MAERGGDICPSPFPPATVQDATLDPIAEFERLSDAALREFANTYDVPLSAENAWDRVVRAKNVYRNSPTLANLRHVFEYTHQYIGRMDEDTVPDAEALYRYVQGMVAANWVPAPPAAVPAAPSSEFEHLWQAMLGEYANNQNVPFSAENAWDRVGEAVHAYRNRPSIDSTERILECMHRYVHQMHDYTIPAAAAFYDYMRHVYRGPAPAVPPAPAPEPQYVRHAEFTSRLAELFRIAKENFTVAETSVDVTNAFHNLEFAYNEPGTGAGEYYFQLLYNARLYRTSLDGEFSELSGIYWSARALLEHIEQSVTPAPTPAAIPDFITSGCREILTHFMHEVHIEWRGLVGVDSQYRDLCAAVVSARTLPDMQQVVCAAAIFMCAVNNRMHLSPLHLSTAALQHYILRILSRTTTPDSMQSATYDVHRIWCAIPCPASVCEAYRNLSASIIPNRETAVAFYDAVTQHFTADHELRIAAARLRFLFA